MSTLSVFGEGRGPHVPLLESDDLTGLVVHGGYSQSKWVADRILIKVWRNICLPCCPLSHMISPLSPVCLCFPFPLSLRGNEAQLIGRHAPV